MAELEGQLAEAREALARQKQEYEENATSFGQVMARLSHSERTLGQTKAKLMDAEERLAWSEARGASLSEQLSQLESRLDEQRATFERELEAARLRELEQAELLQTLRAQNEAKTRELEEAHERSSRALAQETALRDLAESLSRDSAEGAAECARLNEYCKETEEREQRALGRALNAESEQLSALNELRESQQRVLEMTEQLVHLERTRDAALASVAAARATLAECEVARALDQRELASADQERARFVGIFGALETLGREIAEVGFQARKAAESRPKVQPPEPESERVTLRPDPAPKPAQRSVRSHTAPEITVDGVRLDR